MANGDTEKFTSVAADGDAMKQLDDNQFLKVKPDGLGRTVFELYEVPQESWKRPKRWQLAVPQIEIYNRHKKASRQQRIVDAVKYLFIGADSYFFGE